MGAVVAKVPEWEDVLEELDCEICYEEEGDSEKCGCDCAEVEKWKKEQEEYEFEECEDAW